MVRIIYVIKTFFITRGLFSPVLKESDTTSGNSETA